jgi:hypothetical protein
MRPGGAIQRVLGRAMSPAEGPPTLADSGGGGRDSPSAFGPFVPSSVATVRAGLSSQSNISKSSIAREAALRPMEWPPPLKPEAREGRRWRTVDGPAPSPMAVLDSDIGVGDGRGSLPMSGDGPKRRIRRLIRPHPATGVARRRRIPGSLLPGDVRAPRSSMAVARVWTGDPRAGAASDARPLGDRGKRTRRPNQCPGVIAAGSTAESEDQ